MRALSVRAGARAAAREAPVSAERAKPKIPSSKRGCCQGISFELPRWVCYIWNFTQVTIVCEYMYIYTEEFGDGLSWPGW